MVTLYRERKVCVKITMHSDDGIMPCVWLNPRLHWACACLCILDSAGRNILAQNLADFIRLLSVSSEATRAALSQWTRLSMRAPETLPQGGRTLRLEILSRANLFWREAQPLEIAREYIFLTGTPHSTCLTVHVIEFPVDSSASWFRNRAN